MKWIERIIGLTLALVTPLWAQGFEEVTETIGPRNALFSTNLAWGDYDSDGYLDLYITNWGTSSGLTPINALYHNRGDGTFEDVADVTRDNNPRSGGNSTAAAWGDYDNDGDLDLYVANFDEQDLLFRNRPSWHWLEQIYRNNGIVPKTLGTATSVAWGDYDNDGYLDLYVGKYYHDNQLYHNDGDGTFTLFQDLGPGDWRDTDDVAWIDYDNDGYLDLYVVNREQGNSLYRNETAGSAFAEVACALSVANREIGQAAAWADYDNDGDLDLLLANVGANALYRNDGTDLFVDVAREAGVRLVDGHWMTADAAWADYDGDGWLDLYLANGGEWQSQADQLLANNGDGTFRDATAEAGLPTAPSFHTAAGWGDYDNDGAPDLYVADGTAQGDRLFRNTAPGDRFIKVQVRGKGAQNGGASTDGIGARVRLVAGDTDEILASRQVLSGPGAFELIFGVPSTSGPYKLVVTFPGRSEDLAVEGIEAGTGLILIEEPGASD